MLLNLLPTAPFVVKHAKAPSRPMPVFIQNKHIVRNGKASCRRNRHHKDN